MPPLLSQHKPGGSRGETRFRSSGSYFVRKTQDEKSPLVKYLDKASIYCMYKTRASKMDAIEDDTQGKLCQRIRAKVNLVYLRRQKKAVNIGIPAQ